MRGSSVYTISRAHSLTGGGSHRLGAPIALLLLLSMLLAAYSPVLFTEYIHHDDYGNLRAPGAVRAVTELPTYRLQMAVGRPLGMAVHWVNDLFFDSVRSAQGLRLIGVLLTALSGFLIYLWMRRHAFCSAGALMFAFLAASLPPFESTVARHTCNYQHLATLLSMASLHLLFRPVIAHRPRLRTFLNPALYAGLVLQVAALLCYQPFAMIFWPMAAVTILKSRTRFWGKIRWRIALLLLLGIAALILYFFAYRWVLQIFDISVVGRRRLTTDPGGKAAWFLDVIMVTVLNFWYLWPRHWVARAVAAVMVLAAVAAAGKWVRMERYAAIRRLGFGGEKGVLVLALLPLSFAPSLMTSDSTPLYRSMMGLAVCVLVYLFFSWRTLSRFVGPRHRLPVFRGGMAALCLTGLLMTQFNLTRYMALPSATEIRMVKQQIRDHAGELDRYGKLYVIAPPRQDPDRIDFFIREFGPGLRKRGGNAGQIIIGTDEFGMLSTSEHQNMPWIISGILQDMGLSGFRPKIASGVRAQPVPPGDDILVLDVSGLHQFLKG